MLGTIGKGTALGVGGILGARAGMRGIKAGMAVGKQAGAGVGVAAGLKAAGSKLRSDIFNPLRTARQVVKPLGVLKGKAARTTAEPIGGLKPLPKPGAKIEPAPMTPMRGYVGDVNTKRMTKNKFKDLRNN